MLSALECVGCDVGVEVASVMRISPLEVVRCMTVKYKANFMLVSIGFTETNL